MEQHSLGQVGDGHQAGPRQSHLSPCCRGPLPGPLHLPAGGSGHGHPGARVPCHRLHCRQLVQYYLANPHQGKMNYRKLYLQYLQCLEWCNLHTRDPGHGHWYGEGYH